MPVPSTATANTVTATWTSHVPDHNHEVNHAAATAPAGSHLSSGSSLFYVLTPYSSKFPCFSPATSSSSSSLSSHHYYLNTGQEQHDGVATADSSGGVLTQSRSCVVPTVPRSYGYYCSGDPSLMSDPGSDFGMMRPFGVVPPPQQLLLNSADKHQWLSSSSANEAWPNFGAGASSNGDASARSVILFQPATNNISAPPSLVPCSTPLETYSVLSGMSVTEKSHVSRFGESREDVPEVTYGYDVIETHGGGPATPCLEFPTRLNVRSASTSLKKYKGKTDRLRHSTESKDRMLGALCVTRSQLLSDVVSAAKMVRASRQRLESQRRANKALVKHIEHLTTLDSADRDCGGASGSGSGSGSGGTDSNPGREHSAAVDGSGCSNNRNNSSHERLCCCCRDHSSFLLHGCHGNVCGDDEDDNERCGESRDDESGPWDDTSSFCCDEDDSSRQA